MQSQKLMEEHHHWIQKIPSLCAYFLIGLLPISSIADTVYHYTPWSQVQTIQYDNSMQTQYRYDAYQRMTALIHLPNGNKAQTTLDLHYTYNRMNQLTWRKRSDDAVTMQEQFGYDANNRLIDFTCQGQHCPANAHYTFDHWNNIKQVIHPTAVTTYHYSSIHPQRLNSPHLMYDRTGNIVQDDQGTVLHYDPFGHLDSARTLTQALTRYHYNGDDKQVAQTPTKGHATYFIYGATPEHTTPAQPFLNILFSKKQVSNLFSHPAKKPHNDTPTLPEPIYAKLTTLHAQLSNILEEHAHTSVFQEAQTIRYALPQNTAYDLLDAHHNVLSSFSGVRVYSPYGKSTLLPSNTQPIDTHWAQYIGFQGQLTDPMTSLQFMGQGTRAYSPSLRRFISYDALSPFNQGGLNGYTFANNNPMVFEDPNGHMAQWNGFTNRLKAMVPQIG